MEEQTNNAQFLRLKKQFEADREHSAKWRKQAKAEFGFVAGDQYSQEEKNWNNLQKRLAPVFNRIGPTVNSVSGMEIANRQEAQFKPREQGDEQGNDILTEASRWFRDLSNADDEDSDAFLDTVICGMGWTETTMDFEQNHDGDPEINSINPLEMYWDKSARKKNLTDAQRVHRVRTMSYSTAKRLIPEFTINEMDANWAKLGVDGEIRDREAAREYNSEDLTATDVVDMDDEEITIVQSQWKEYKTQHMVLNPLTMQQEIVDDQKRNRMKEIWSANPMTQAMAPKFPERKLTKVVIKNAFIGANRVLKVRDALCPGHFSFRCITAFLDKAAGTFYGLVRSMMDPQRYANKAMARGIDIMNSQAQGGIMAEEGAIEDKRQFAQDWTRADKVSTVADGALSSPNGPRILPKPPAAPATQFFQMMEFAISSVRDVTGVNVEMLGLRDANQPASLEHQRRQAGMQILQPIFDNLKRYRREQAKNMLYIIQNYLSDGRLVRILGEGKAKYVPLLKQQDIEYDVIIDDMPNSPNQREMNWAILSPLLGNFPPQAQMAAFAEFGPGSEESRRKVVEAVQKSMQPPPEQGMMQKAQMEKLLAEILAEKAGAAKDSAQAEKIKAETEKTGMESRAGALDNVLSMTERLMGEPQIAGGL